MHLRKTTRKIPASVTFFPRPSDCIFIIARLTMQFPPVADNLSFPCDRALLNPKFESYKLEIPSDVNVSTIYKLPGSGKKLRTLPDHTRLSYAEVQARVRHNHLSSGLNGEVVYIDGELAVIAVTLDQVRACALLDRQARAQLR